MGTSSAFGGQGGNTPLIPSWLDDPTVPPAGPNDSPDETEPQIAAPPHPPIPPVADRKRFSAARNSFTRFAGSDGNDRASLHRAISHYLGLSSGGPRTAAARIGSARAAGSRLIGFLYDAVERGAAEALRALNLDALAGRPIEEVFLGLADYVCPDGGSIDEGVAREAFIETITDLAGAGVSNLNGLTADQVQTVFELFATNAIEARLCNDIGTKAITFPSDCREASRVQAQLHDFIRRGVSDAFTSARAIAISLTPDRVLEFVGRIYEQSFEILQIMGAEGEAT